MVVVVVVVVVGCRSTMIKSQSFVSRWRHCKYVFWGYVKLCEVVSGTIGLNAAEFIAVLPNTNCLLFRPFLLS